MLEFFMGLVEMFQTDPAAFFATILGYAGLTGVSVGTLIGIGKGAVVLTKLIFGGKKKARQLREEKEKFIKMITDNFGGVSSDLSNIRAEFTQSIKQYALDTKAEITKVVEQKLGLALSKLTTLEAKINAFSQVVLDTDMLKLQFETLQNEFLATKKAVEEKVEEIKEVIIEPETPPTIDESENVENVSVEPLTRKLRLKQRV